MMERSMQRCTPAVEHTEKNCLRRRRRQQGILSAILISSWLCCSATVVITEAKTPFLATYPTSLNNKISYHRSRSSIVWKKKKNNVLLQVRGGGGSLVDQDEYDDEDEEFEDALEYEEDEEEDYEEDEEDLDFGDDDESNLGDSDFADPNILDRFIVAVNKTPPVTKTYLGLSCATALYSYLCNGNEFPNLFQLDWNKVIKQLQIWRPFTAFLNFGSLGLGYALTLHFVWHYMSTLERLNHKKPYDFWIMIAFGQSCMLLFYAAFKLNPRVLGHNLSTFLVYIWSKYAEGSEVNMFELFLVKAEMLPYMMLAQTYLLEGDLPILDALGIVFGHTYHHLRQKHWLTAPRPLQKWYAKNAALQALYQPIASEFEAQDEAGAAAAAAAGLDV